MSFSYAVFANSSWPVVAGVTFSVVQESSHGGVGCTLSPTDTDCNLRFYISSRSLSIKTQSSRCIRRWLQDFLTPIAIDQYYSVTALHLAQPPSGSVEVMGQRIRVLGCMLTYSLYNIPFIVFLIKSSLCLFSLAEAF